MISMINRSMIFLEAPKVIPKHIIQLAKIQVEVFFTNPIERENRTNLLNKYGLKMRIMKSRDGLLEGEIQLEKLF